MINRLSLTSLKGAYHIQNSQLISAAKALAGEKGLVSISRKGLFLENKTVVSDPALGSALVERNLRNLLLDPQHTEQTIFDVLKTTLENPAAAENLLLQSKILFNLPEALFDPQNAPIILPQENVLFLIAQENKGNFISKEQIANGEVDGLGESMLELMEAYGFDQIYIGEGTFVPRFMKLTIGGHIEGKELGMEKAMVSDWAALLPRFIGEQEGKKCIGITCAKCLIVCPSESIIKIEEIKKEGEEIEKKGKKDWQVIIDLKNCKGCGLCVEDCPETKIKGKSIEMATKEILLIKT